MPGRYIRNVRSGEQWDPTMTGVEDVGVFHPGDYIQSSRGYMLVMHIQRIDARTRFLECIDIDAYRPGATLHDLRENDARNFYYNGMMNDGRAPADVMTFEEAKQLYQQVLSKKCRWKSKVPISQIFIWGGWGRSYRRISIYISSSSRNRGGVILSIYAFIHGR